MNAEKSRGTHSHKMQEVRPTETKTQNTRHTKRRTDRQQYSEQQRSTIPT